MWRIYSRIYNSKGEFVLLIFAIGVDPYSLPRHAAQLINT